jgi:tetratricopeptide (TPR) repeat protein
MKWLPVVILMLVVGLVAVVTGCGGAVHYDSRLTAADSLMRSDPDSALAIVEGLPLSELATAGDSAYHDLLLTQARYRCYVTATSDSAINHALAYYCLHNDEQEKLTRAYLYKGAVMEELGHPDSAMLYYKHAEATAAPDDYFNLGYAKIRIAELYQGEISQDTAAIRRAHDAIHYFGYINDSNYLIVSHGILGAIFGLSYPDSAKYHLNKAVMLSTVFDPSLQYTYKSKLAGLYYYYDKDYRKTIELAMDILINGRENCYEDSYYFYAALSFLELGKKDSAMFMYNLAPHEIDESDVLLRQDVASTFALLTQNHDQYQQLVKQSIKMTEEFLTQRKENTLIASEKEFDKLQVIEKNNAVSLQVWWLIGVLSLSIIVIALLLRLLYKRIVLNKLRQQELVQVKSELEIVMNKLCQERDRRDQESTYRLVNCRISALNELYSSIRMKIPNQICDTQKTISLSKFLKALGDTNGLSDIQLSDSFWEKMKFSVDGEFNGIATFIEKQYPNLSDQDLKLFYLLCARLPVQIIKLCMNYTNAKTSSNYRNRIIRKKMGLNMSFDEFVQNYLDGEFID